MILVPAILLFSVLLFLSGLHVYWALGGRWGLKNAIPEKDGVPLFNPGKTATLFIALALLGAAVISLWRVGLFEMEPGWVSVALTWAMVLVFAMRAVGDFRYCGFFKRVKGTAFAQKDTLIFSPLCALLAILALCLSLG